MRIDENDGQGAAHYPTEAGLMTPAQDLGGLINAVGAALAGGAVVGSVLSHGEFLDQRTEVDAGVAFRESGEPAHGGEAQGDQPGDFVEGCGVLPQLRVDLLFGAGMAVFHQVGGTDGELAFVRGGG